MSVRDRLALLGTDLGDFNQVDFGSAYTSIAGVNLADGYCSGVCLDWTRRVLQSAPNRDPKFLNYSKNALRSQKQTDTLQRMAVAYAGHGLSYVTTTRQGEVLTALKTLLAGPNTGAPIAISKAVAKCILQEIATNVFNLLTEPAALVPRTRVEGWLATLGNRPDPQRSPLADGGREWGQYAEELDAEFSQGKKRTFAKLVVVRSSNQQTYVNESAWHGDLKAHGYQHNCCTIIGLAAPGDTGHAVAVHQVDGNYRFFDPNYGVFLYNAEGLGNALKYLFWAPLWEGEEGPDTDLPVCRRRTKTTPRDETPWTNMSYTIFRV